MESGQGRGRLSSERHLDGFPTSRGAVSLVTWTVVPEHLCGDRGDISSDMGNGIGHPRMGKMNNDGKGRDRGMELREREMRPGRGRHG